MHPRRLQRGTENNCTGVICMAGILIVAEKTATYKDSASVLLTMRSSVGLSPNTRSTMRDASTGAIGTTAKQKLIVQ